MSEESSRHGKKVDEMTVVESLNYSNHYDDTAQPCTSGGRDGMESRQKKSAEEKEYPKTTNEKQGYNREVLHYKKGKPVLSECGPEFVGKSINRCKNLF